MHDRALPSIAVSSSGHPSLGRRQSRPRRATCPGMGLASPAASALALLQRGLQPNYVLLCLTGWGQETGADGVGAAGCRRPFSPPAAPRGDPH